MCSKNLKTAKNSQNSKHLKMMTSSIQVMTPSLPEPNFNKILMILSYLHAKNYCFSASVFRDREEGNVCLPPRCKIGLIMHICTKILSLWRHKWCNKTSIWLIKILCQFVNGNTMQLLYFKFLPFSTIFLLKWRHHYVTTDVIAWM